MHFLNHYSLPEGDLSGRPFIRFAIFFLVLLLLSGSFGFATAQESTPEATSPLVPTATPIPRPFPTSALTQERTTLEFYFAALPQGTAGLLHIKGAGMAGGRARFLNNLIDFFAVEGEDGYFGLVSVSMEQNPRNYDLDIFTWYDDETRQTINTQVEVITGRFLRAEVTIPPDKAYLVDPEIERDELARMDSVFSTVSPEKLWDSTGFALPIPGGELTSSFGDFRTFNESVQTRHTGWDVRASLGQPILAAAAGTVAFAGLMQIRGNLVVVDHGYGVFSTYSHFSQVHVTRGQSITKGQVLGLVGNTGRTSGPHFHWEMAVNGVYVDSVQFMNTWLP